MNWQRVYSPWRELVKSLSTEREPVKSTKLHIVFYLLQIISLLMSSVQKLPPEVSCSMLRSQFGSSEILGTLLLTTLFHSPLAAVSFILQVAVNVDRDAGWSARYAMLH